MISGKAVFRKFKCLFRSRYSRRKFQSLQLIVHKCFFSDLFCLACQNKILQLVVLECAVTDMSSVFSKLQSFDPVIFKRTSSHRMH